MEVLVVDYGAGNLTSVMKALRAVGCSPVAGGGRQAIARATAIVIPGVGHFSRTASIDARARDALRAAISRSVPVLGICLGLQWLFDGSEEAPEVAGLGVFSGRCFHLGSDQGLTPLKIPHVGWNTVDVIGGPSRLLGAIAPSSFAYFTHTFAAPVVGDTSAVTTHGVPFSAVVERGSVFGAQFHPEKSGSAGLRLLANFVRLAEGAR
jgi:glutamine amidotransferase